MIPCILLVKAQFATERSSNYINNSLHLALKYAGIFVRGHDLFAVSYEEYGEYSVT